ncbi:MAG: family 16 glycoside hydrolase [Spirosomataceae bacterium]
MKHTAIFFINQSIPFFFFSLLFAPLMLFGQNSQKLAIALTPELWQFQPQKVEFKQHEGVAAMKILPDAGSVVLHDFVFSDFTLEFDTQLPDPSSVSVYFRWNGSKMNECFSLRTARAGHPAAGVAVQYAPSVSGVSLSDILPHFQGKADFKRDTWTHVKVVVSGAQMRAYVNHALVLEVMQLEGETTQGRIAFGGQALIARLTVTPKEVEHLSPQPGIDPTTGDPRYLRHWQVSAAFHTPENVAFSADFLPNAQTVWETIEAERRGLVNLTRPFGESDTRRFAWLKVTINTATALKRKIELGLSDEVWVFLNGRLLSADKTPYGQSAGKDQTGQCTPQNSSFSLPLTAGANELLIGVANNFCGWGLIAKLDSPEGLTVGQ